MASSSGTYDGFKVRKRYEAHDNEYWLCYHKDMFVLGGVLTVLLDRLGDFNLHKSIELYKQEIDIPLDEIQAHSAFEEVILLIEENKDTVFTPSRQEMASC
ncbi:hypothetical protein [Marinicella sp. W31]|uniref:hypothetical protein n=1 Tax=Marinicella sp. W31 TaxID=3023713 RepID=UPI0037564C1C